MSDNKKNQVGIQDFSYFSTYFNTRSIIDFNNRTQTLSLYPKDKSELKDIVQFLTEKGLNFSCNADVNKLTFTGTNAIDFIGKVFPDYDFDMRINLFINGTHDNLQLNYKLTLAEGIPPVKSRLSDTGYDLHLVKLHSKRGDVYYYDTGVSVTPPPRYYFDLVGRSSIAKTGYMLANNVGIIDASYTGSVIVALYKFDKAAEELVLPVKLVQLIPRPLTILEPNRVDKLSNTTRQDKGGLGSGNL